ncbi:UDP-glucose 4-epimerase GalE [Yinghuangia sp. YIM S09857]|uniref:UDP-glucose 4-epimerase GalE n=1 Tax=Yinghuangia sp. YIM S09857 TaxID=3436929 RepID=UPI003F5296BC
MHGNPLVLVTGGAGFIGSHTCVELLAHDWDVVVVDDHSNSSPRALERIEAVARRKLRGAYAVDLLDRPALSAVFDAHPVDAVVHFAARKAVGESVRMPAEYYDTNIGATTALLRVMGEHDVRRLVFSSSCSVYGDAARQPVDERAPARPTNPYAQSKHLCETVIADVARRRPGFSALSLRCFNPIGAHPGGLLGEDPRGEPGNLLPYIAQVAVRRRDHVPVFGDDYATPDGTGVRDYTHVLDVAEAHRLALRHVADRPGATVYNIGTGRGTSVLDLIAAFGDASGREIPYRIEGRRPGDVATLVADAHAVRNAWGRHATRGIADMCRDAWTFQQRNPRGYADPTTRPPEPRQPA